MQRARVAVLVSGRGSNLSALIDATRRPDYPAEIVGVFANRPDAPALGIAAAEGLPTAAIPHRDYPTREAFDAAMEAVLLGWRPDILCLAGFMRLLSPGFVERWQGRILNIHPSLLPRYRGLDTHRRVLEAGDVEHGCTVHFVTPGLDEGPAILQARVPVLPGDTPESLAARVLVEEHKLYPQALAMVARGEVTLSSAGVAVQRR
ncbi:MAG TPA: phosphoribosylglycinamide formyltransferase [Alphaproteobacteria bacterium]|nr:phosphoribosylglycinamide formyltransferase [Alphaproteobacteria bacterium]